MRLYLASTSPARLQTLRAAGIEPIAIAPGVDEAAAVEAAEAASGPLEAPDMVQLLARLKAEAIVGREHEGEPIDGLILGGDSAFLTGGAIHGKPHRPEVARERWLAQKRQPRRPVVGALAHRPPDRRAPERRRRGADVATVRLRPSTRPRSTRTSPLASLCHRRGGVHHRTASADRFIRRVEGDRPTGGRPVALDAAATWSARLGADWPSPLESPLTVWDRRWMRTLGIAADHWDRR
jgi:septum formation protein